MCPWNICGESKQESLAQHMLDTWYNVELYSSDSNGKEKFLDILEDESIGQGAVPSNDLIVEIHQEENEKEENNKAVDEG